VRECGVKDQVSRVGALDFPRLPPWLSAFVAAAAVVAVLSTAACSPASSGTGNGGARQLPDAALVRAGTLTVAIDNAYPPFAGLAGGHYAGLDIDVGAALADQLGLKVAFVPYDPAKPASLAPHSADIALGAATLAQATALKGRWSVSYALDGPALFSADPATLTLDALSGKRIGAQDGSEAYWRLRDVYGPDVRSFASVRDAFVALTQGRIDVVGADALVGGYVARDFPKASMVGVVAAPRPIGVVVLGGDAVQRAVTSYMAVLEKSGVLKTLRLKWTGSVSERLAAPSVDSTGKP
jgi:polar amino acid transport system substrate-binding protein